MRVWFTQFCTAEWRRCRPEMKKGRHGSGTGREMTDPITTPAPCTVPRRDTWTGCPEAAETAGAVRPNAYHVLLALGRCEFLAVRAVHLDSRAAPGTADSAARNACVSADASKRYRHTCSWFRTNEFECLVAAAVRMRTDVGSFDLLWTPCASVVVQFDRGQSHRALRGRMTHVRASDMHHITLRHLPAEDGLDPCVTNHASTCGFIWVTNALILTGIWRSIHHLGYILTYILRPTYVHYSERCQTSIFCI